MGFSTSLNISGSALNAERLRMDVIASNIANANSTHVGADGGAFKRQEVVFAPGAGSASPLRPAVLGRAAQRLGVGVVGVVEDNSAVRQEYRPGHPDADAQGYVSFPEVDTVREMTDMMSATRAYEANVSILDATKNMAMRSLDIGRG